MSFRECAVLIFERLGIGPLTSSYLHDLERVNEAACEWYRLPEQERGGFLAFELPDLMRGVVHMGNLNLAIEMGWAQNEAAKAFVRFIDERSGKRGTLLMLQVILLIQQAIQDSKAKVNAQGGNT